MNAASKDLPALFIAACIIFSGGVVCLSLALILPLAGHVFRGFVYISLALIAFGTGEIINHPRERLPLPGQAATSAPPRLYRRRNVCSLGNLCDIFSLLLLFAGIAALIYPR